MITFMPYADFTKSARVLDNQRLSKQRMEVVWILRTLKDSARFPSAVRNLSQDIPMWSGYGHALVRYGIAICQEWRDVRGFKDHQLDVISEYLLEPGDHPEMPPWFGNELVHASHRSNLLRKKLLHYRANEWEEPTNLPYYWPSARIEQEDICFSKIMPKRTK